MQDALSCFRFHKPDILFQHDRGVAAITISRLIGECWSDHRKKVDRGRAVTKGSF